jgi:hypothetical protein
MDENLRKLNNGHKGQASDWPLQTGLLQRKCECGNHTMGGECADCSKKKGLLQRKEARGGESASVPPIVNEVLQSSGESLDRGTRDFFESRFGQDFSRVRVHADDKAARAAGAVFARAYTVGNHIGFASGEYTPTSARGRKLLAHELTHVVQQSSSNQSSVNTELRVGAANDSHEDQADQVAEAIAGTGPISQLGLAHDVGAGTIRRKVTPSWTVAELKKMLTDCDGGLGIWAKAKKANKDKDPIVTPGAGGATDPATGNITLDETKDRCFAVQQLIQELSNLSRMADFNKIFDSAAAGDLSREDFIRRIEKIEYETGVMNVLTTFDACKDKWPCTTTPKEWARKAKDFDDYFSKFLSDVHKEHYGTFWDSNYKPAYDRKHPRK